MDMIRAENLLEMTNLSELVATKVGGIACVDYSITRDRYLFIIGLALPSQATCGIYIQVGDLGNQSYMDDIFEKYEGQVRSALKVYEDTVKEAYDNV